MALENSVSEDKIKKPNGGTITRANIVENSVNYYKQAYQENLTDICDFNQGSEIRTIHESFAVELFELYKETIAQAKMKFVKYASGSYLDELACEHHLNRRRSEVAKGTVSFSTSTTIQSPIEIPKGTVILARDTGYEYILQQNVVLTVADSEVSGTVYSKLRGAKYNVEELDKLTAFKQISRIRNDIKVTNVTKIVDGKNRESDESLRTRIYNAKKEKAFGTAPSMSNIVLDEVNDVHDIQLVDPTVLIGNVMYPRHYVEGTTSAQVSGKTLYELKQLDPPVLCTKCSAVCFVNGLEKPCPDDVVNEVEKVLTQQNNLIVGQKLHFEKPKRINALLEIELYTVAHVDEDVIYDHLKAYIDGGTVETINGSKTYRGFNIGDTLYKARLIDVIEDIPGVYQVGGIWKAKYNKSIPVSVTKWDNNGGAGFSYEDEDGYVYHRTTSEESSINYWGTMNFTQINGYSGGVINLPKATDYDKSYSKPIRVNEMIGNW